MDEIKLHHVFTYTDVDRDYWAEHFEDWLPRRIIDSHVHFVDPRFQIETVTEEMRRQYWVFEVNDMLSADTAQHCAEITFPGREVSYTAFGFPTLGWDIEASNAYVFAEARKRGWLALALVRPTWVAGQVDWLLKQPGVIGLKPCFMMIDYDKFAQEGHMESNIFDFLPHHQLEVVNEHGAWITLHVPKAGRLGHPDNLRQIREIRRRYPQIKLVIAHLGRSYTLPHAREGLLPLAEDPGLYFDTSAVLNPDVHELALKHIGPERLLYGSDNPVMYMRGRRQFQDRAYLNRTSYPFYFNKEREAAEIEARYTLYMYEDIRAIKEACQRQGCGREQVEAIFFGNADRMRREILNNKLKSEK